MIKLGLQTITWGDPQDPIMEGILSTAGVCGYDGVEIGWRRVAGVGPDSLKQMLEDKGLPLWASHAGGNLVDATQAEGERRQIDGILDGLARLGTRYLLYSGFRYVDDQQLATDLATLNETAQRCAARGVQLLYHNHDWEFADGSRAWDALTRDTTDEMGFCPDVGWMHKAGQDCVAALDGVRDRVVALHFKDFRTCAPGVHDFCCLGDGCVPFVEVAAWAHSLERDTFWVMAEQDEHDGPAEEAVARNAAFLRECFPKQHEESMP